VKAHQEALEIVLLFQDTRTYSDAKFRDLYERSVSIANAIDLFLVFNATFSNIMATSFSDGRGRSTRREPPTMGNW
jgi:hypothetical protein